MAMLISPASPSAIRTSRQGESEYSLRLNLISRHDTALREGGMQVHHMRHDGGSHDSDNRNDAAPADVRHDAVICDIAPCGAGEKRLDDITRCDDADQCGDDRFHRTDSVTLHGQNAVRRECCDDDRDAQVQVKEQIEAQRRAQELGEVSRHRPDF